MNTLAMARAYISDARKSLNEALENYRIGAYHRCIRRCQECVELSLKGILRLFSIEYPRKHDVSEALEEIKSVQAAPSWLKAEIDDFKKASVKLAVMRGPAFYGDEKAFIPPEKLYSREDAEESLETASKILDAAEKLLALFEEAEPG